jgi:hypothetical protein
MNDSIYHDYEEERKKPLKTRVVPHSIKTERDHEGFEITMDVTFDWDLIHELWMRGMRDDSTRVLMTLRLTHEQVFRL